MSELRRDPVIGRWVIIDSSRNFGKSDGKSQHCSTDESVCPFCPGNEYMTRNEILVFPHLKNRVPNSKDWQLRVIPNNKPVLEIEGSLKRRADGMYDKMDGVGAHEIIIETPLHSVKPSQSGAEYYERVFRAAVERIRDLRNDSRIEYILFFKNYGIDANAVFEHPYSQLIAMPVVPKRVKEEIEGGKKYFTYKERCVFCDIVSNETAGASRMVCENDFFAALCPYASRYPFETWIIPKNHSSDFDSISQKETAAYAQISAAVYSKLNKVLDDCAYSSLTHTGPLKDKNAAYYHWHCEIIPKLTKTSGFEWGTGLYINPVSPEEAAKYLRESE